jgi:hypothetical protein
MPCMRCSNGKYKYGEHGDCMFDTLAKCQAAAAAIHIHEPGPHGPIPEGKKHDTSITSSTCTTHKPTS